MPAAQLIPPDAFLRLERRIEVAKETVVRSRLDALGKAGVEAVKALAPKGGSGRFEVGLAYKVDGHGDRQEVHVLSRSPDAQFVESGRRPGKMPPVEVIVQMLHVDPSQAFVIARAIGEKGTKGYHVFEQASQKMHGETEKAAHEIADGVGKFIELP